MMRRGAWWLVSLVALVGCGGIARPGSSGSGVPGESTPTHATVAAETQAAAPPSAPSLPSTATARAGEGPLLERSHTGQDRPTVVVRNGYPRAQQIFIDWDWVGAVAPGQAATFELVPGSHTITGADSADPDDNATSLTEIFESGYRYGYQIRAR